MCTLAAGGIVSKMVYGTYWGKCFGVLVITEFYDKSGNFKEHVYSILDIPNLYFL